MNEPKTKSKEMENHDRFDDDEDDRPGKKEDLHKFLKKDEDSDEKGDEDEVNVEAKKKI